LSELKKKYLRLVLISGLIILFDQVTKAIILNTMPLYQSVSVIPNFFDITHIHNMGGAFGVFAGQSLGVRKILFLFMSSVAICVIVCFYHKTPRTHPLLGDSFALILGGAAGNLIDRFRMGEVVDFLDFYIGGWHWPAFNVADAAISTGVGIFLIHMLFNKMPENNE